jgi:hypothetical protein
MHPHKYTPKLLGELFETCRALCPQCYAPGEQMGECWDGTDGTQAYCKACNYVGQPGDWKIGWLCHTLRNAVAEKLRAEKLQAALDQVAEMLPAEVANALGENARNENVTHAARPVNIGRNEGASIGMRVPRSETIGLCTSMQGGEHVWQPTATPGNFFCACGARRQVHGRNLQSIPKGDTRVNPRATGPMYMHHYHEGNVHATPMPTQGEGNMQHTHGGERSTGDTVAGELPKGQG